MQIIRVIIVLIILIAIITSIGFLSYSHLESSSEELVKDIETVENHIFSEDWKKAELKLDEFNNKWSEISKYWAILTDHFEIDNINATISKMSILIKAEDKSSALSETASLQQYIKHIPERESFVLKNIF